MRYEFRWIDWNMSDSTRMKPKPTKPLDPLLPPPYNAWTADEMNRMVAKYDAEFSAEGGRLLNAAERRLHRRAAARGRPQVGAGAEKVRISVERGLLTKADAFAKKRKTSRSQLIAEALRLIMSKAS